MHESTETTSVAYLETINSVISEVGPFFLEDGVPDMLSQLKNIWIKKLNQAMDLSHKESSNMPIKVTLPNTSVFPLSVPKTPLTESGLTDILQDPVSTAIFSLPQNVRSSMLQNYVKRTLNDYNLEKNLTPSKTEIKKSAVTVLEVECESPITSADESSVSNEENSSEENEDDESLNSDDDITDEEKFTTENIILCQYSRIFRHKNKWKFHFTNGIMNLNDVDYVFNSLKGDAAW